MREKKEKTCGVVMPISECDGMPASHWIDVLEIISSAATEAGFDARLVSDTFESNLIHKEILQNIYQDEMIIVDVSGRNPNVFFELGIRMATQKPTVIVKDDQTAYPFDTGPNRYIGYPRDLRHPSMEKFKSDLSEAIRKTETQIPEASFIGQLGPFQIPDVESTELPASEIILDRLNRIEKQLVSTEDRKGGFLERAGLGYKKPEISVNNGRRTSIDIRYLPLDQIKNGVGEYERTNGESLDSAEISRNGSYGYRLRLPRKMSEEETRRLIAHIEDAHLFDR